MVTSGHALDRAMRRAPSLPGSGLLYLAYFDYHQSMQGTPEIHGVDLSAVGALLAEPARAAILLALAGGVALPASELAQRAGVTPSTTSTHLARLLEVEWVAVERYGRHRYYRLASP